MVPILATPFREDEALDLASLRRLVRFNARVGANAVTVLGVLGESDRLSDPERETVVRTAVKAAGAMPVVVGASRPGTAATVAFVQRAAKLGAAAAMVAPPDAEPVEYFRRVGRAGLPIVVQDNPGAGGTRLSVELLLRLVREIPAVAGIKCEAPPTPPKIAALKHGMRAGRKVPVLSALGALYGRFDLERGADGFNSGFAFPEVLQAMLGPQGPRVYARYLPLIVFEQQPGPAIRKEMLRRRGLIATNRVRHPGTAVDEATAAQLGRLLDEMFPGQDIRSPVRVAPA